MNMAPNNLPFLITIVGVVCTYCSEVSAVVHIAPDVASCGEVENCTSLTDYAKILSVNPSVSTDLVFLPGNHVLYNILNFSGVSDVTLLGDCSSSDTCPLITCNSSSFIFRTVTRTVIANLRFVNCLVDIGLAPNTYMSRDLEIFSQITNCSFSHAGENVLIINSSNTSIEDSSFTNITADSLAAVTIQYSVARFNGNNTFMNNMALVTSLYLFMTNATFNDNTLFCSNTGNAGGSVDVLNGYAVFNGNTTFCLNYARFVGALYAYNSTLSFHGETLFEQNSADYVGALIGEGSSKFFMFGNVTFYNNTATHLAGGLGLIFNSQIYFAQESKVVFELNRAGFEGGALYVEDTSVCYSTPGPCFFQVTDIDDPRANLTFINNFANVAGDDIYGGGIDGCLINNNFFLSTMVFDHITTFHHDNSTISSIASDATQVCECVNDVPVCQPRSQCTLETFEYCTISQTIYPGETIQVTVAAVGQREGVVPGEIRAVTGTDDVSFDIGLQIPFSGSETIEGINATCTTLSYTVTSTNPIEILSLYPKASICRYTHTPLSIALFFLQPCPYGFQTDPSTGACVCEEHLMSIGDISCNITHRSFQHRGEHWIGFDNSSKGLIIHDGRCPFDYCITNQMVNFTLENTNEQCSFNRSGLLCGGCQDDLSILLGGTSRCERCSNDYLALLIPFVLAGIGLVVLLFVCELSVVAGTLSGLIFYANVVQINRALFFKSNNVLTIFIAWLNLDLGIETCFYDGIDSYGKTWLQFLFPFYIWAIVGLIILLSSYSKRVTKVLGSHPIAVLATLFLLSYVKILRVFISVISFDTLDYPNRRSVVWQSDANVGYLQEKHIPLFVVAVLVFLLLFVPYTVLLLFGQWFQTKAHWKCMAWAKSQRLKAFLDVYHAPYKDQHRYWPGLLLLLRIALAVINATAADSLLLAVTYAVMVTVLLVHLWGWIARGVYKKWPLDVLEAVFFANLGLFVFATYHIGCSGGNQMAAANTSVSITLLVFAGILLYHILVLRLKLGMKAARYWMMKMSHRKEALLEDQMETTSSPGAPINAGPETVSYVSLRELLLEDPN